MMVYVVDDNRSSADALSRLLQRGGHSARAFYDGASVLRAAEAQAPGLILTDLNMEPVDGLQVLRQARQHSPPIPVLVFTAFGDVETAVEAVRLGAMDFLMKPVSIDQVLLRVAQVAGQEHPLETPQDTPAPPPFIAISPAARTLLGQLELAAGVPSPVWLEGEVGSGRSHAARTLHQLAHRSGPFLRYHQDVQPTNWPEETTLLVEHIDRRTPEELSCLHEVLQQRPASARIVCTAAPGAAAELASASDVMVQLAVLVINVPPLRQRVPDILPLFNRYLSSLATQYHRMPPSLSATLMDQLQQHRWTGNLRELKNFAERALVLGPDTLQFADRDHLPDRTTASHASDLLTDGFSLARHMEQVERGLLEEALRQSEGDRAKAGRLLGVERNALRYKLNKYGLI